MNLVRRINNYMFEEVETDRMLLFPEINSLFAKIRQLTPMYRRQMLVGFACNFFYSTVILSFFRVYRTTYDLYKFFSHYVLLFISFALNSVAFLCKIFIVNYYVNHINVNDRVQRLIATTRRLILSRIYVWSVKIGHLLFLVSSIELIFSFAFMMMFESTQITILNLLLSLGFIVRTFINFKDMTKVYNTELADSLVSEMIRDLKSLTISSGTVLRYDDCFICFKEFESGEDVRELSCLGRHVFHESCLRGWFKHKSICPLCKTF
jgi:hypothetical protein